MGAEDRFANKLQVVRIMAGITQAELADKSGVSAGTISKYERGCSEPKLGKLSRICSALGVNPAYFTGHEELVFMKVPAE